MSDQEAAFASPVPPQLPVAKPSPWGFWPTLGMGVAIAMTFLTIQSVVAIGLVFIFQWDGPEGLTGLLENIETLILDGRGLSISMFVSFPVMLAGCVFFAHLRQGIGQRDYFSLRPMRKIWWILLAPLTIGFSLLLGWLLQLSGAPETNEWMLDIADSAREYPLLLVGLVLFAPIAEEFLFRGFLFRGWEESKLGIWGTIFLTSLTWALIHGQYDVYGLTFIFALGILLGVVRWKTGSIYAPILIHIVNNGFAMFMVMTFSETPPL